MNIGFDAKRAYSNRTGLGNYARTLMGAYANTFPENRVYGFAPAISDLFSGPSNYLSVEPKGIWKNFPSSWRRFGDLKQATKLGLDVFHGLSNELPMRRMANVQLVTIHDLLYLKIPEDFKPTDRRIYARKVPHALKLSDGIVCVSQQTADDLSEYFRLPYSVMHVIYQSCSPIFYTKVEANKIKSITAKHGLHRPYVICVGTLEPRKNQVRLVEAFIQAKLDVDFDLVLIGKNTANVWENCAEAAARSKNNAFLKHLTRVENEDLPALYQAAACAAYVSLAEGFGIPVLEAIASGTPIVASGIPCVREAGGPVAYYANPTDVESIAAMLLKAIERGTEWELHQQKAPKHLAQFDPETLSRKLNDLYKSLY